MGSEEVAKRKSQRFGCMRGLIAFVAGVGGLLYLVILFTESPAKEALVQDNEPLLRTKNDGHPNQQYPLGTRSETKVTKQLPLDWDQVRSITIQVDRPPGYGARQKKKKQSIDKTYRLTLEGDRLKGTAETVSRKKPFSVLIPADAVTEFRSIIANLTMAQGLYADEFDPTRKRGGEGVYRPHFVSHDNEITLRIRFQTGDRYDDVVEIYTKSHMHCERRRALCGRFPWVVRFGNVLSPLSTQPSEQWMIHDAKVDDAWEVIEVYLRG